MISHNNRPERNTTNDEDFTTDQFRELCQLAITNWRVADYKSIPWNDRFILWRHDVDISLNRALALAKIENQEGLKATYFINPHSEFYNIHERNQFQIIKEIISLGHDLGLHFDIAFYNPSTELSLDNLVIREASHLESLFGIQPAVFSFHNPTAAHLHFEAEYYGGLLNCYSRRFKKDIAYCSDSNGYWRFRRLKDVLKDATDDRLQVLTHPGWWQTLPMAPRQRVFRSVYGRATATLRNYDKLMSEHGRINQSGYSLILQVLRENHPDQFELCNYLWNMHEFQTLFFELWRILDKQMKRLCKACLQFEWFVPIKEIDYFFSRKGDLIDAWVLLEKLHPEISEETVGGTKGEHQIWSEIRNQLLQTETTIQQNKLEHGCLYLCTVIKNLAEWGYGQSWNYNGLSGPWPHKISNLTDINVQSNDYPEKSYDKLSSSRRIKWTELKNNLDTKQ
jgi:hypothetical protein